MFGQAVQRPLNPAGRAAADSRHQNRVILQVVGARLGWLGRDEVDTELAVGEDAVGQNRVACPDSTETPARMLKAMVLPAPAAVPPMVLFEALLLTITPLISLPSRSLAGDIGADQVALDEVAGRRGSVEPHAPVVGGDQVLGCGGGAADRVAWVHPEQRSPRGRSGWERARSCPMPIRLPARDSWSMLDRR